MHSYGYRHMPVVENGQPLGVISLRDDLSSDQLEFNKEIEFLETITETL